MDKNTADHAIQYLQENYTSVQKVKFFGGEPILNFSIIKYIVEELEKKLEVRYYEMVTNATLIADYMLDFFDLYKFKIIISLDGPDYIHDQLRNGCCHKDIIKLIHKIQKLSISNRLTMNCTYTNYHKTAITTAELEDYFDSLHVRYIISNVITEIKSLKLNTTEQTIIQDIDQTYFNLINHPFRKVNNRYVSNIINAIVYHNKSENFCEDITGGICFYVDGNAYPCAKLIQKCELESTELQNCNYKKSNMCMECWARNLCSGCAAEYYLHLQKEPFQETECMQKKYYEYSLECFIKYLHTDTGKMQKMVDNFYQ